MFTCCWIIRSSRYGFPLSVGAGANIGVNRAIVSHPGKHWPLHQPSEQNAALFSNLVHEAEQKKKSKTSFYIMLRVNTLGKRKMRVWCGLHWPKGSQGRTSRLRLYLFNSSDAHLDSRNFTAKDAPRKYMNSSSSFIMLANYANYTLFICLFPLKRTWTQHKSRTWGWGYLAQLCFSCLSNLSCNDDAVLDDACFCLSLSRRLSLVGLMLVWPVESPTLCCVAHSCCYCCSCCPLYSGLFHPKIRASSFICGDVAQSFRRATNHLGELKYFSKSLLSPDVTLTNSQNCHFPERNWKDDVKKMSPPIPCSVKLVIADFHLSVSVLASRPLTRLRLPSQQWFRVHTSWW